MACSFLPSPKLGEERVGAAVSGEPEPGQLESAITFVPSGKERWALLGRRIAADKLEKGSVSR